MLADMADVIEPPHVGSLNDGPVFNIAVAFTPCFIDGRNRDIGCIHESQPGSHNEERAAKFRLCVRAIDPLNRQGPAGAFVKGP